MCYWNLDLKFKAKLKLQSGNRKNPIWPPGGYFESEIGENQYIYTSDVPLKFRLDIQSQTKVRVQKPKKNQDGRKAILRVTSLKINKLLPMATNNMHIKFEIEIPQQTWVMLRKPCRLQTDGQTDRRTRWIQYTNVVGQGYNNYIWNAYCNLLHHESAYCGRSTYLLGSNMLESMKHCVAMGGATGCGWPAAGARLRALAATWGISKPVPGTANGTLWVHRLQHRTQDCQDTRRSASTGNKTHHHCIKKKKIEWNICGIIHHENPSDIHRNFSHMYQKWQRSKMQHSITVN